MPMMAVETADSSALTTAVRLCQRILPVEGSFWSGHGADWSWRGNELSRAGTGGGLSTSCGLQCLSSGRAKSYTALSLVL